MADEARAHTLRQNLTGLLLGVKFNLHFPWFVDIIDKLPLSLSKNLVPPGVIDMMGFSEVEVSFAQQLGSLLTTIQDVREHVQ